MTGIGTQEKFDKDADGSPRLPRLIQGLPAIPANVQSLIGDIGLSQLNQLPGRKAGRADTDNLTGTKGQTSETVDPSMYS